MRIRTLAAASAAALLTIAAPAGAQGAAACGLDVPDTAFDNTTTLNPSPLFTSASPTVAQPSTALDLRRMEFVRNADGTTNVRLTVTNMSRKIPLGSTSVNWTVQWTAADGTVYFVRAVNDLANNLVYEWGVQVPPVDLAVTSVLPRYEYRGETSGRITEGPDGGLDILIPEDLSKPGSVLGDIYAQASEGRQVVPNAGKTPTRGLSSPSDRLPNTPDVVGPYVTGPCQG